jgi:hypothetical protein
LAVDVIVDVGDSDARHTAGGYGAPPEFTGHGRVQKLPGCNQELGVPVSAFPLLHVRLVVTNGHEALKEQ